jgi:peptidyl-prolyl cis-trans isomerase SurA
MYTAQLGEAQGQQPSPEQADTLRLNIVRELIDEEIVQQRAAKMNLTATAEDVDARLAEMKAPYTEEQFAERLKASNHTLDDVKHDLRRSLTIDKLLNKEINSKVTVSDADIAKYYNQHKDEYNLIETRYHLAEIRVTGVPSSQPGNLQGSKEPARCGRGLRRPGDELLREPRDRLEWRRHGLPLRIGNARRRPRDLRRRGQAKGG